MEVGVAKTAPKKKDFEIFAFHVQDESTLPSMLFKLQRANNSFHSGQSLRHQRKGYNAFHQ